MRDCPLIPRWLAIWSRGRSDRVFGFKSRDSGADLVFYGRTARPRKDSGLVDGILAASTYLDRRVLWNLVDAGPGSEPRPARSIAHLRADRIAYGRCVHLRLWSAAASSGSSL